MKIERLKEIREEKGLKQSDIAKILNIKQPQYSKYETGKRLIPATLLCILARYYDTSVDYILGKTNVKAPYPKSTMKQDK